MTESLATRTAFVINVISSAGGLLRNRGRDYGIFLYLSHGLSLTACERLIEIDNEGSIELGLEGVLQGWISAASER